MRTLLLFFLLLLCSQGSFAQNRLVSGRQTEVEVIQLADLSNVESLAGGSEQCESIEFDPDTNSLYWLDLLEKRAVVLDLDRNSPTTFFGGFVDWVYIATDSSSRSLYLATNDRLDNLSMDSPTFGLFSGQGPAGNLVSVAVQRASGDVFTANDTPQIRDGVIALSPLYGAVDGLVEARGLKVTSDGSTLFWVNSLDNEVRRAPADGSGPIVTLYDAADGVLDPTGLTLSPDEQTLYITLESTGQIVAGDVNGATPLEVLLPTVANPRGPTTDPSGNLLYYCNSETTVGRLDLTSGENVVDLLPEYFPFVRSVSGVTVSANGRGVSWLNQATSKIFEADLGARQATEIAELPVPDAKFLVRNASSGEIYWYSEGDEAIFVLNSEGQSQVLFAGQTDIGAMVFSELTNSLIWTVNTLTNSAAIMQAEPDQLAIPSLFPVVIPLGAEPFGVYVTAEGTLFWSDSSGGSIYSVAPDAGTSEEVFAPGGSTRELVFDTSTDTIYFDNRILFNNGVYQYTLGSPDPHSLISRRTGALFLFVDNDQDGVEDSIDLCDDDPAKGAPGQCGCGFSDEDSDTDGTADCLDLCPMDAGKLEAGVCGCGVPDIDSDGDGALDCQDLCEDDPEKIEGGLCGCGVSEIDTNQNDVLDCLPVEPVVVELDTVEELIGVKGITRRRLFRARTSLRRALRLFFTNSGLRESFGQEEQFGLLRRRLLKRFRRFRFAFRRGGKQRMVSDRLRSSVTEFRELLVKR